MTPELKQKLDVALGGEYRLSDGRVFWMDGLAVREILRRIISVLEPAKTDDLWPSDKPNPGTHGYREAEKRAEQRIAAAEVEGGGTH